MVLFQAAELCNLNALLDLYLMAIIRKRIKSSLLLQFYNNAEVMKLSSYSTVMTTEPNVLLVLFKILEDYCCTKNLSQS